MYIKRVICIVSFIILGSFLFVGCSGSKNSPEKQTIICGLESEPASLDPQVCSDTSAKIVIENLFEGLTKIDSTGNVIPCVAETFESNSNFTEYTFRLKKGVYWACKEKVPVLAKDFIFAIRRALWKETQAKDAYLLYCIKGAKDYAQSREKYNITGIKMLDDYTLNFILEYPVENFPRILAEPIARPCNEDFFKACEGQYGMEGTKILSNGPFRIKTKYGWDHFNTINLIRNENYASKEKAIPQGVTFIIKKANDDPLKLVSNKTLDISFAFNGKIPDVEIKKVKKVESGRYIYWGLFFNLEDEYCKNLNFRKSLVFSINRESILSAISKNEDLKILDDIIAGKLLQNGKIISSQERNEEVKKLYFGNPKKFLNAFFSETKIKKFTAPTILCLDSDVFKDLVSDIIEDLNDNLGHHFNMLPLPESEFKARIAHKDYQIAVVPVLCESEYANDILNVLSANNSSNFIKIDSAEYSSYLNSALSTDAFPAECFIKKAGNYILENALFYPLYQEPVYYLVSKNLSNVDFLKNGGAISLKKAKKIK